MARSQQAKNLVAQIIDEIDRRISLGALRPGQRIIESELESLLGVSRVPVREAIRILSGEGVLEITQGRGARIRLADEHIVGETVKVLAAITNAAIEDLLDQADLKDRVANLRCLSLRLVALSDQGDPLRVMRAIGRYHWNIVIFCGNGMLRETLRKLRLNMYHHDVIEAAGDDAVVRCGRRYEALTDALERRDKIEALELSIFLRDTIFNAARRSLTR